MEVAGMAEVGTQLDDEAIPIDEHRASPATLAEHGQVLIVTGEIDVFNLEGECLADAATEFGNEAEEQTVTATMGGSEGGCRDRRRTPVGYAPTDWRGLCR